MEEPDKTSFDPLVDKPDSTEPAEPQPATEHDYAKQSRRAGSYMNMGPAGPKEPIDEPEKSGHRNLLISFAVLVVLALIAGSIYWFTLKKSTTTPAATSTSSNQSAPTNTTQPTSLIDTKTKNYNSPNFKLSFNYPADWTLSDNGGGTMTVKSPAIELKDATGQSTSGIIVLTIRQSGQKLPEFNAGNATAVRDSVKIAYTTPTQTQRASTYLSFLQYATTRTLGAMDGVYITADYGYKKDQAIPLVDVQKVDPVISITFTSTSGKAMSIPNTMWDNSNFSGPLTKMLESFAIQ